MFSISKIGLLILGGTFAFIVGQSCGDVTDSRVQARDKATNAACARYAECNLIGPGLTYETTDSCKVAWLANWEMWWPPVDCQGRINQSELSQCISAIGGTDCNAFDVLVTLGKCNKADVCGAVTDAGSGG